LKSIKNIQKKISRDRDTFIFLRSFARQPIINIKYAINLAFFILKLSLRYLFSIQPKSIQKYNKINRILFFLKIINRAKYLKKFYLRNRHWSNINISNNWYQNLPTTGWEPNNVINTDINAIKLASHEIIANRNLWVMPFPDQEDTMSVHRFGWLIIKVAYGINKSSIIQNINFILGWINDAPKDKNNLAWEAYTVSERIVNWLLILMAFKPHIKLNEKSLQKINNSIQEQITHLLHNLEYRKNKTNNHIINNARALYFGGRLLGIDVAEKIGREILINETKALVPNGILKEGSSHYQLLVTRTYLEIYWLAYKTQDKEMLIFLSQKISEMINFCHLLTVKNENLYEIPFIGDISPDFSPNWFFGYPFSNIDKNNISYSPWSNLWGDFKDFDLIIKKLIRPYNQVNGLEKRAQWLKLSNNKSSLFFIIKSDSIKSHIHQDEGSFYYSHDNIPIIIDPGLNSYVKDDPIAIKQMHSSHHSGITVNGCGLYPPRNSWMSITGMKPYINYEYKDLSIHLSMKGYRSLGRWIKWDRIIELKNNQLILEDFIDSKNNEIVEIRFIINNKIKIIKEKGYLLKYNDFKSSVNTSFNGAQKIKSKLINGYYSNNYGTTGKCQILSNSVIANGPVLIKTNIEIE